MAARDAQIEQAATRGLDTTSSPARMAEGFAPVHRNLLVHRDGVLPMRGPIAESAPLAIGTTKLIAGAWQFDDKVLVSFWSPSATATRVPHRAPYKKAANTTDLAVAETTMVLVDLAAGTVANCVGDANKVIHGRGVRLGAYVYGFAADTNRGTNAPSNEQGGYLLRRRILKWDGTTTAPTVYTNAPEGGQDVIGHLNRLWTAGGRDVPGGAPGNIEFNTLYQSDLYGPTADTVDVWKDDATPFAVRKTIVDSDNPNDFLVGVARQNQNMVIFKRRSVWVQYGYSPDTFQVRNLTSELGATDPRGILEQPGEVYWLSASGFHVWSGDGIANLHAPVEATLVPALQAAVGDSGVDGGFALLADLPNDYLLISVGVQDFATGAVVDDEFHVAYLYHVPTGRFTEFRSDIFSAGIPVLAGRTTNYHWMTDGSYVVRVPYVANPELAPAASRGFDFINAAVPARDNEISNPRVATNTTGWTLTDGDTLAGLRPDEYGKQLYEGGSLFPSSTGTNALDASASEGDLSWATAGVGVAQWVRRTAGSDKYIHYDRAATGVAVALSNSALPSGTGVMRARVASEIPVASSFTTAEVVARYVDPNNFLAAGLLITRTAGVGWTVVPRVYKTIAGGQTTLWTGAGIIFGPGSTYDIELRTNGTAWEAYHDGVLLASGTDADLGTTLASGKVGLLAYSSEVGFDQYFYPEVEGYGKGKAKRVSLVSADQFTANGTTFATGIYLGPNASAAISVDPDAATSYTLSAFTRGVGGAAGNVSANVSAWSTSSPVTLHYSSGAWERSSASGINSSHAAGTLTLTNTGTEAVIVTGILYDEVATMLSYIEGSVGATSNASARIPAAWHTRLKEPYLPQEKGQNHRLFVSYAFQVDNKNDDTADAGWFVSVVGGHSEQLHPEFQVPGYGETTSYLARRCAVRDTFWEVDDYQIRIEWKDDGSGTYPALVKAELYDTGLETQRTRQTRSH